MADASSAPFRFASALSTEKEPSAALAQVLAAVKQELDGPADFAQVFFTREYGPYAEKIARDLCEGLGTNNVIGCTGEAIVGVNREIEDEPAISLWAARLPGVNIRAMHLEFQRTADGGVIEGWAEELAGDWPKGAFLFLLADPFFFPVDHLLERMNEDRPGVKIIGGNASGGHQPGMNRLICGPKVSAEGASAVVIDGPIKLRTVVSQGCRPIGKRFIVTKAERNVLQELGGRPALLQLKEIFDTLPAREQALVQNGLHVGRVVSEYQEKFEQGDYLVRNVIGIDPNNGSIAVGDYFRVGQTVCFHVRDEETADAELKQLLAALRVTGLSRTAGAILYTCNGRGTRLFRQANHDAGCVAESLGKVPLTGFFAQGEIGPIGGQNFLHGFTAAVAVLEPK